LSPPFLLPEWRPPLPEQRCVRCGLRHAYVCRRRETPCFSPGVSSPLFLFRTSSPPLSLCWILPGKLCASPFARVMHIVCRCHEAPCFFPGVSSPLFSFWTVSPFLPSVSSPRILMSLFVGKNPCLLPILVRLLTQGPHPGTTM
jgi:hypothetical protein